MKRLITILLLIAMIMTFSIGANATDKEPYMVLKRQPKRKWNSQQIYLKTVWQLIELLRKPLQRCRAPVQQIGYTPTGIFTIMVKSRITLVGLLL